MSFLRSARGAAAVAWVASFAHLLVLFNRAVEFSFGTVLVAATGLLASLPAIWAASAVIIAPGDVARDAPRARRRRLREALALALALARVRRPTAFFGRGAERC